MNITIKRKQVIYLTGFSIILLLLLFLNLVRDLPSNTIRVEPRHLYDRQQGFFKDWLKEQARRKSVVEAFCTATPTLHHANPSAKSFIYEPYTNLLYCGIAKVGKSTWFAEIVRVSNISDQITDTNIHAFHTSVEKMLGIDSPDTVRKKIKIAESFTMVRHPFARLVSAYKNKILDDDPLWEINRSKLTEKYGDFSFKSFLTYIANEAEKKCRSYADCWLNVHWVPYVSTCAFCQMEYKYLLKSEEFADEVKGFSIATNVSFTPIHNNKSSGKTSNEVAEYFKQIPQNIIQNLTRLYEPDFKMFEYDPEQFFNI